MLTFSLDGISSFVQMVSPSFFWLVVSWFYSAIGLFVARRCSWITECLFLFCLLSRCSRLRQCSRNILHVNVFLCFLIRSAIQLFTELRMTRGYFAHNVFQRVDACNFTTIYFKEDQVRRMLVRQTHDVLSSYSIVNCIRFWWITLTVAFHIGLFSAKPCISFVFCVQKHTKIEYDGTY